MKIRKLRKRTETGYTFAINFGPFWVRNWWFNADKNNVVGPAVYVDGKAFSHVLGHGMHFVRLRDLVSKMVREGIADYDSDEMLPIGEHKPIEDSSKRSLEEILEADEEAGSDEDANP